MDLAMVFKFLPVRIPGYFRAERRWEMLQYYCNTDYRYSRLIGLLYDYIRSASVAIPLKIDSGGCHELETTHTGRNLYQCGS
jgi:hypothetical protein